MFENGVAEIRLVMICENDDSTSGSTNNVTLPPRDSQLDTGCVREALEQSQDPMAFCGIPAEEVATVELTPDMVAAAFARIPLPAAEVNIQPPNGRTLVNFDTNFYTDSAPLTRTVTLLGRQVTLDITPTTWTWTFGDGTHTTTTTPGAAYPDLDVTHAYQRAGDVAPSVATTYTATYRVDGSPPRPVPGSVTIPGPTTALQVDTARPRLTGTG